MPLLRKKRNKEDKAAPATTSAPPRASAEAAPPHSTASSSDAPSTSPPRSFAELADLSEEVVAGSYDPKIPVHAWRRAINQLAAESKVYYAEGNYDLAFVRTTTVLKLVDEILPIHHPQWSTLTASQKVDLECLSREFSQRYAALKQLLLARSAAWYTANSTPGRNPALTLRNTVQPSSMTMTESGKSEAYYRSLQDVGKEGSAGKGSKAGAGPKSNKLRKAFGMRGRSDSQRSHASIGDAQASIGSSLPEPGTDEREGEDARWEIVPRPPSAQNRLSTVERSPLSADDALPLPGEDDSDVEYEHDAATSIMYAGSAQVPPTPDWSQLRSPYQPNPNLSAVHSAQSYSSHATTPSAQPQPHLDPRLPRFHPPYPPSHRPSQQYEYPPQDLLCPPPPSSLPVASTSQLVVPSPLGTSAQTPQSATAFPSTRPPLPPTPPSFPRPLVALEVSSTSTRPPLPPIPPVPPQPPPSRNPQYRPSAPPSPAPSSVPTLSPSAATPPVFPFFASTPQPSAPPDSTPSPSPSNFSQSTLHRSSSIASVPVDLYGQSPFGSRRRRTVNASGVAGLSSLQEIGEALPGRGESENSSSAGCDGQWFARTESGAPLRPVFLPARLITHFVDSVAKANTAQGIETCALLLGRLAQNEFTITTLLVPKQEGTPDTCTTTHEEEQFEFQDSNGLMTLGWIHTHPTQSTFLSSLDLHTHAGYQVLLAEAIAIVAAPRADPNFGIFRMTDPPGLETIVRCTDRGLFHPHPDLPLYTDVDADWGHCRLRDYEFETVDLRSI
ncbi:hypothetical protein JCM10212_003752 [Sporobolomyces blumeae]